MKKLGIVAISVVLCFVAPVERRNTEAGHAHPCDCGAICGKQFKCGLKDCPHGR